MINLNGTEFNSPVVAIFNNGVAGKVENVKISIEKRKLDDPDNAPAYKIIFTDDYGSINMGLYYPTEQSTESQNKMLAQKCADLVKAVTNDEFIFPEFASYTEMLDGCMKIIAQNSENARVNVFATYGTVSKPKNYLGIYKPFNFIEKTGTTPSKLKLTKNPNKPEYNDLLEKIEQDVPQEQQLQNVTSGNTTSQDDVEWFQ